VSEVADLLAALREGALDLDTVARRFRERSWPAPPAGDPVTTVPGSFEEVVLAYARGDLTDEQYATLLCAAVSATGGA
jgi:hypothetical protein